MSSYQRMLVHRVAAYFGMDHNVDQTGNAVIVNRTKNTRLPDTKFRDHIREELLFPEEPRRSILKRDSSSFEDSCNFKNIRVLVITDWQPRLDYESMLQSPERQFSSESRRSKSFEEREEEYEKARKRIFNREDGGSDPLHDSSRRSSQEELRWPGEVQPWSSSDSDMSSRLRSNMLLHASDNNQLRPVRLPKGESFECRDTLKANSLRLSVSKSYSFGGYPVAVLSRGDSCTSTHSAGARLLTKQDSGSSMSSRLSPSSSGYKSQSQRSDTTTSATPSPTATPVSQLSISSSTQPQMSSHGALSPQHTPESSSHEQNQTVMWAVTSMASVPPGSVLINPQTGQPYVNSDGSVYRYDPANPPKVVTDDGRESVSVSVSGSDGTSNRQKSTGSSEQMHPPAQQQTCQSQKSHPSSTSSSATLPSKTVCSTHVTTTATSPSLPMSPPPALLPNLQPHSNSTLVNTSATSQIHAPPQQPVLTICHSSQCSYVPNPAVPPTEPVQLQQHLGTLPVASIPMCPQLANTNSSLVNTQTHSYPQQQFVPALQHQQPEMMFGNQVPAQAQSQQPTPPQMVFASYNMVPVPSAANGTTAMAAGTTGYEQRHSDGTCMAISDLSSYFMGLGLVTDQRGGGGVGGSGNDNSSSQQQTQPSTAGGMMPVPSSLHHSHHPHNYQSQPPAPAVASATPYWQPQQQSSPVQHSQQQTPQQPAQQPLPMYYVPPALAAPPPPPVSGSMLSTSPPQQATSNSSNPATPRYMAAYPPYQQVPSGTPLCHPSGPSLLPPVQQHTHQDRSQQSMGPSGGYIPNYPVVSYGAAMMAATGNGECMSLYSQPSLHMLYTPTSINVNSLSSSSSSASALPGGSALPYYHPPSTPTSHTQPVMALSMGPPYMQPSQPGTAVGAYRAPTPPQTPTQSQTLCNMPTHSYVYLNGGGYTPMYSGGGTNGNAPTPGPYSQQSTGTPSTPGPSQYIPPTVISNLGLFRSNMQMMSSVTSSPPPPRPSRDGLGLKPSYSRSPSVGSKDRSNGSHYDTVCGNDKTVTSMRYPSIPMFGLRIMPGDMRVMSQQPLSSSSPALRMPFNLPPHPTSLPTSHHPAHRMQQQSTHYTLGSQSSGSEVSIGSVGRPPKPRKQRSKITTTVATNPVQNSPPQAGITLQPQMTTQAATVTLSTAGEGTDQETGRVLMINEGNPSKQH
ncbi:R3H domain-containing protein 1 [Zootermopsis nevadensis]|uniref:R3H domain-containing protein 1 n=1 Tax=Zootermopsis nevadensis TaxID=136037 RepID=UPI000B8E3B4E|nr:R3H domain-containing protein 1 [Zootermopsis nevadensis]